MVKITFLVLLTSTDPPSPPPEPEPPMVACAPTAVDPAVAFKEVLEPPEPPPPPTDCA